MAMRLESTSAGSMGSGFLPLREGSQPPAPRMIARRAHLPDSYGIPLLELLVVDPYFIFISWEITSAQLDQARKVLGEDFETRRLRVLLLDEAGNEISSRELYGEVGRWFIQLNVPGVWLRAELQFVSSGNTLSLNNAGPVFIPRDTPVEPEGWEELFVNYAHSEKGELRIESLERERTAWPRITLEATGTTPDPAGKLSSANHISSSLGALRADTSLLRPLLPAAPANTELGDD